MNQTHTKGFGLTAFDSQLEIYVRKSKEAASNVVKIKCLDYSEALDLIVLGVFTAKLLFSRVTH